MDRAKLKALQEIKREAGNKVTITVDGHGTPENPFDDEDMERGGAYDQIFEKMEDDAGIERGGWTDVKKRKKK